MTNISLYPVVDAGMEQWADKAYMENFVQNGAYWKTVVYSTALGGCLFGYANVSGMALMRMERMRVGWYLKNCTPKVLVGWLLGMAVLIAEYAFI